jgi:protein-S-isoprenylcysteine O-methyltransferase Ste14
MSLRATATAGLLRPISFLPSRRSDALVCSAVGAHAALLLLPFFAAKARREETWLVARYPDEYPAYRRRVRRLIPWVY